MKYYTTILAQAYGKGAYGACAFSEGQQTGGGCADNTQTSRGLADTGIAVIAILTLASFIIFLGLLVRFSRRKSSAP